MKPFLLAAALLAPLAALPAEAQKKGNAAQTMEDGSRFCEIDGVVLREQTSGGYVLNFYLLMPGNLGQGRFDRPGMFGGIEPRVVLFYSGLPDAQGKVSQGVHAFAVTGTLGDYALGDFARDDLRIVIDAGSFRTPPLKLSVSADSETRVTGTVVEPGAKYDASDSELPRAEIGGLADAALSRGATLILYRGEREIARIPVPAGTIAETHKRALDWAEAAYPLLKQGKCPD
ncbi:hypothetical protein OF829_15685 [Sphingomonas sp. LB-2]|uniref:hypothetical protein n=1 Tax=Sphingomonas caeni TaxID=2984949 RepID=UPI00222E2FD0|nr:hypothetical protein [Sphingomonas caeni]MCW3848677.1 hypothetical protein [Sphingomonas caeni]